MEVVTSKLYVGAGSLYFANWQILSLELLLEYAEDSLIMGLMEVMEVMEVAESELRHWITKFLYVPQSDKLP